MRCCNWMSPSMSLCRWHCRLPWKEPIIGARRIARGDNRTVSTPTISNKPDRLQNSRNENANHLYYTKDKPHLFKWLNIFTGAWNRISSTNCQLEHLPTSKDCAASICPTITYHVWPTTHFQAWNRWQHCEWAIKSKNSISIEWNSFSVLNSEYMMIFDVY